MPEAPALRVEVDLALCVGHGRCYELAPEIFGEDESGYCILLRESVPESLSGQARSGEANCPEGAIRVEPVR